MAKLAWVEPNGNAIVITKQASGTAKIEPLVAAFNAVAWIASNPASTQPSVLALGAGRFSGIGPTLFPKLTKHQVSD